MKPPIDLPTFTLCLSTMTQLYAWGLPVTSDETTEIRIQNLYDQLLSQLTHLFPNVDRSQSSNQLDKRRYGREGRKKRNAVQLTDLAKRLNNEIEKRKIISAEAERREMNSDSDVITELRLRDEMTGLRDKLYKLQNKMNIQTEKTTKAADLVSTTLMPAKEEYLQQHIHGQITAIKSELTKVMQILDEGSSLGRPSDTPSADHDHSNTDNELSLKKLLEDAQTQSHIDETPPKGDDSKQTLATDGNDAGSDCKVEQLAAVVKNLIEVNQLAYIDLNQKISSSKSN